MVQLVSAHQTESAHSKPQKHFYTKQASRPALCYAFEMKFIRIFLLVLIIIGLILLATQKIWVPKLVDAIIASENTTQTSK